MKLLHRTLLVSALLAVPFAAPQARESTSAHEAWIKAQKIDIEPTLKVTETQVPADSVNTAPSQPPGSSMPSSNMPSSTTPYPSQNPSMPAPAANPPMDNAPVQDRSTMPRGMDQSK